MSDDDNHPKFKKRVRKSEPNRWRVARHLSKLGMMVTVPPPSVAEKRSDWREHADKGDLFIQQRVETKHLDYDFTGRNDWPHRDFLVCTKRVWDDAVQKPGAFISVSKDGRHAGTVRGSTRPKWYVRRVRDEYYKDYEHDSYAAPLECVEWTEIDIDVDEVEVEE